MFQHFVKLLFIRAVRFIKGIRFATARAPGELSDYDFELNFKTNPRVTSSRLIPKTESYQNVIYNDNFSDRGHVNGAVIIENTLAFGNFYIQLRNAFELATALNYSYIIHQNANLKEFYYNDIFVKHNNKFDGDRVGRALKGDFFYNDLIRQPHLSVPKPQLARLYLQCLGINSSRKSQSEYAAIHIRDGDIFNKIFPNPNYMQPPVSFYQNAIRKHGKDKNYRVISNSNNSPVTPILINWLEKNRISYVMKSQSLNDDLELLYNASCIIASRGTFLFPFFDAACDDISFFVWDDLEFASARLLLAGYGRRINLIKTPNIKISANDYWINSNHQRKMLRL